MVCFIFAFGFSGCKKSDSTGDSAGSDSQKSSITDDVKTSGSKNTFDIFNIDESDNEGELKTFLDFDYLGTDGEPKDLPEFTQGKKIDVDTADFPDAVWVKGYEDVSKTEANNFMNESHNLGYRVL